MHRADERHVMFAPDWRDGRGSRHDLGVVGRIDALPRPRRRLRQQLRSALVSIGAAGLAVCKESRNFQDFEFKFSTETHWPSGCLRISQPSNVPDTDAITVA